MTAAEQQSYTLLACLAFQVETMVMVEVMMKVVEKVVVDEEVDEEQLGCRG